MLTFAIVLALASPSPSPSTSSTPNPLTINGYFRSYLFTRQNASNNPGAQFNYTPGAKYSSTGVNQVGWEQAIDLHAEYALPGGWYIGGAYLYGDPFSGPCSEAATHIKGNACVSQRPPNTNPDDTVPDFILSTFYEGYLGYRTRDFNAKVGDQVFDSPWAGPADTRIKPESFQGGDFEYTPKGWTFELADMLQFQPRSSSTFISSTLLTSFPAGNRGLAPNIYYAGGGNITTPGFLYGRIGFAAPSHRYSIDGYLWSVTDIVNMYWGDAQYTLAENRWKPYIALQGGLEYNAGASVIGKIDSSLFGAQIGAHATRDIVVSASYDELPWHYDNIVLPAGFSCSNSNYQIKIPTQQSPPKPGNTLAYFLPLSTGQCLTNPSGSTTVAYGGWASPFTDNYANAPLFTTAISESVADRRAPGTSWRIAANYDSPNRRVNFIIGNSWFDYSNALVPQTTTEFNLDGTYRFMPVPRAQPYHGLRFRYRYADRRYSNTFCGAVNTSCPASLAYGASFLGGNPIFKYNRAMLEYDF
ncbi:MAG TPA: hypothetical protein VFE36_05055 [Candidatus Baltobacteraceae bacterium]|jgi:hypothetical protein|nr:hypothetical protein [Candidatus Baltobacteraceae bacterium]